MKKNLILLIFLSFSICWKSSSQSCLPDGIIFSTQSQIDSFDINYPDCTIIEGKVTISGDDITDLFGLFALEFILDTLMIHDNPALNSLHGLNNLIYIKDFIVSDNAALENFSFMGRLLIIDGEFSVSNNNSLNNFSGLNSLNIIKGNFSIVNNADLNNFAGLGDLFSIEGVFLIENNIDLENFEGLNNLYSIPEFKVYNNDGLIDFVGLNNFRSISATGNLGSFRIADNDNLVNFNGLQNLEYIRGIISVKDNLNLTDFFGLEKIKRLAAVVVENNNSIINFNGLNNLDTLQGPPGSSYFYVLNNSSLENFTGLEKLSRMINTFRIENNTALTSLVGLENLNTVPSFVIKDCPNLSFCAIQSVCNHIENGGSMSVSNNASGCNSVMEIESACLVPVEELLDINEVEVFPNPSKGIIQLDGNNLEDLEIRMWDTTGKLYINKRMTGNREIDITHLPGGLYYFS